MNWVGLSLRSLLGTLVGVFVGVWLFLWVTPSAWVVGAATGAGCALLAEERSGLRGVSVATCAVWAAAAVDAHRLGVDPLHISSTLSGSRWVAYLACLGLAFVLGGASIRPRAKKRLAGT